GALLGKPRDVLGLLREIAKRNKKREIGIAVSGCPKHCIELVLHVFPDSIAPWPNDHTAAHIARFSQLSGPDDLLIPLGKILIAPRTDRSFFCLCHRRERIKPAQAKWLAAFFCNFFAQLLLSTPGMKIKSLIVVATLVGAVQLSSVVVGQDENEGAPSHGGRWQNRMTNLSPDDQQKLTAARQKAMQDPTVQAAEEKMKEARRAYMSSVRAGML